MWRDLSSDERTWFYRLALLSDLPVGLSIIQKLMEIDDLEKIKTWVGKIQDVGLAKAHVENYHVDSQLKEEAIGLMRQAQSGEIEGVPKLNEVFMYYRDVWTERINNENFSQEDYHQYSRHLLYFFMLAKDESTLSIEFLIECLELVTKLRQKSEAQKFSLEDKASISYRGAMLAEAVLKRKGLDHEDGKLPTSNMNTMKNYRQNVIADSDEGKLYSQWYDHLKRLGLSLTYMGHPEAEAYLKHAISAAYYLRDNQHNISGAYQNLASYYADVVGDTLKAYETELLAIGTLETMSTEQREGEQGFENYYLRKLRLLVNHTQTISDFLYSFLHPMKHIEGLRALFDERQQYGTIRSLKGFMKKLEEQKDQDATITSALQTLEAYQAYGDNWKLPDIFTQVDKLKTKKITSGHNINSQQLEQELINTITQQIQITMDWADDVKARLQTLNLPEEVQEEIEFQHQMTLAIQANHLITTGKLDEAKQILDDKIEVVKECELEKYWGTYVYLHVTNDEIDEAYDIIVEQKLCEPESFKYMKLVQIRALLDDLDIIWHHYKVEDDDERAEEVQQCIESLEERAKEMRSMRFDA